MTEEEYRDTFLQLLQTPEGREQLSQIMRDNPITREQMQAAEDRLARKHGKSINDIVIKLIRSGELDDDQIVECMEMVEGAPELLV